MFDPSYRGTTVKHSGRIFRVVEEEWIDGDREYAREIIEHPGAAGAIPIFENGDVMLVSQYREALKTSILEIPAGLLEPGEDPVECVHRELREEVGLEATDLRFLARFSPSPGVSNEQLHLYVATGLTEVGHDPEPDELLAPVRMSLENAVRMAKDGGIVDAKTIIAVLMLGLGQASRQPR